MMTISSALGLEGSVPQFVRIQVHRCSKCTRYAAGSLIRSPFCLLAQLATGCFLGSSLFCLCSSSPIAMNAQTQNRSTGTPTEFNVSWPVQVLSIRCAMMRENCLLLVLLSCECLCCEKTRHFRHQGAQHADCEHRNSLAAARYSRTSFLPCLGCQMRSG